MVAISPDLGERYTNTVYDDEWVAAAYGADCLKPTDTDELIELTAAGI